MDKINGKSLDLIKVNVQKLKQIFPEIVLEDKIDFEALKLLLGEEIDDSNEKYQFTWNGKNQTKKYTLLPSTSTLIPEKNKSVNWDKTQNIYIEGDNLEVLKLLQKTYFGKIKMIYIDPPYNTGKDFVYKDNFHDNLTNYKNITNQASHANPETNGRYHTDWLNMMFSRLQLAKNLLTEDGVIFISIDDNEVTNLTKLCNEVFGENNFIAKMVWKSKSGGANDVNTIACDSEFILAYASNIDKTKLYLDLEAEVTTTYNQIDENGKRYSLDRLDKQSLGYHESLDYPIIGPDGRTYVVEHKNPNNKVARWRWGKDTVKERYDELVFKYPYVYTKNYEKDGSTPRNLLIDDRFGRTRTGKTEVAALFDNIVYFDFPKPTKLIKYLISISTNESDIIMDFFSGSATTAHSVFLQNISDNQNRKFILVQLPELTDKKSKAYLDGYLNICDIGEERIRRAGLKIYNELKDKYNSAGLLVNDYINPEEFDFGFKVFKLESTNIKPWDGSRKVDEQTIFDLDETVKEDRTDLDVTFEIMLKYGVFNMPLKEVKINNKTMYNIGEGYMIICLDNDITSKDVMEIANQKPYCVVFKEQGFADDNEKINATYTLERLGVEDVKCI